MGSRSLVAFGLALAWLGCGPAGTSAGGLVADVSPAVCASGQQWQGGNRESQLMRPGEDCIACHTQQREGPRYAAAGTVYATSDALNDCVGEEGIVVELTGADGVVQRLTTNATGNFFTSRAVALPYKARLIKGEATREMAAAQTVTACNSCHTATGAQGAPGRIQAP